MATNGIFVTGTDTGVGKTVVSAAFLTIIRDSGIDAVPMKPIQTGCERRGGELSAPDLEFMLGALRLNPDENERRLMCPYRFEAACSPHLAARKAGIAISLWDAAHCLHELAGRHATVVVEGAGGVLVPVGGRKMMIDLIAMLKMQTILVARSGVGTINHTMLSLGELKRAGVKVAGIILNSTEKPGPRYIEEDNRKTIESLSGVQVIGHLGYMPGIGGKKSAQALIRRALHAMPQAKTMLRRIAEP
jgi:dethiobiotin synthetase